jgi:hypothetical protein
MALNPQPNHPSSGSYVLKLHRDADPRQGRLSGRIEHIVSGEHHDFASSPELIDWLQRHAAVMRGPRAEGSTP